jgi:hypothetical protein
MTPVVMILYFPEDHASNDEYTSERGPLQSSHPGRLCPYIQYDVVLILFIKISVERFS